MVIGSFGMRQFLSHWEDQLRRDEDVSLALVFPDPPRNDVTRLRLRHFGDSGS